MSRTRFSYVLIATLILTATWQLRPTTHAADPAPAEKKSPEEMKPGDGAKPLGAATPPLTWPPGRTVYDESDAERKIREALQQPTDVDFKDTPLGDVVDFLEKRHEINILLDKEALAADGKGDETPITQSLRDIPLGKTLRLLFDDQGLTYVIKNDVMLITIKAFASTPENLTARVYQVHDLVVAPNDPTASQPDFDSLMEMITTVIRQSDWAENGGTTGQIRSFQGPGVLALLIQHEERGHEEIEQLLKTLRAAKLQAIYEAQAQQPLKPRSPVAVGLGGPGSFCPIGEPGGVHPSAEPKPTGTATESHKAATPAQSSGGGYF